MLNPHDRLALRIHPVALVPILGGMAVGMALILGAGWLALQAGRTTAYLLGILESYGRETMRIASMAETAASLMYWGCVVAGGLLTAVMGVRLLKRLAFSASVIGDVLELRQGLMIRRTSQLELFRIVDLAILQTPLLTLAGAGHLIIWSNDQSDPRLVLFGIRNVGQTMARIRDLAAQARSRGGVVSFV